MTPAAGPGPGGAWTEAQAEQHLLDLELFGMHFGLERMRRLLARLDDPQRRFASVHVVGTNGKSSTVRMTAALLGAHGLRAGAYLSPHLVRFAERIRVDDRDLGAQDFAAAVQRTAAAAAGVDADAGPGEERVTQFEAMTAAALLALAEAGVDVAVIEAGLGGRWDATNVLPSAVQVLTNVGLEHTRWLGDTVAAIAAEKLDVVQPGATLVVGADLHPDARAVADEVCAERGARLVVAPAHDDADLRAAGTYQQANFATARAAAGCLLATRSGSPTALDPAAVRAAAAATLVPGRFELIDTAPDTYLDGAHNRPGAAALARAVRAVRQDRRVVLAVSVLDDKDAGGMLAELLPICDLLVCTTNANPRALEPAAVAALAERAGFAQVRLAPTPHQALAQARQEAGPDGMVVATGSIYLVADLVRPAGATRRSTL